MKMSDVWPHVDFTYGKFQKTVDEFGEVTTDDEVECLCGLVFSNEEPAKATMHAIQNHDRLTSENARLREVLLKIQRIQERTPELPYDYSHDDVGILNDRIDEVSGIVNTALTELEKGDE